MASTDKKKFKITETSKQASVDITSDKIQMPADSADHILVATVPSAANVADVVNVEVEMSPDGENWCNALTKSSSSTSSSQAEIIGNEKYADLTVNDPVFNGHGVGGLHYDNSNNITVEDAGTRDFMHALIEANKCFNQSMWIKSDVAPTTTYKPVLFRHGGHDTFENTKNIKLDDQTGAGTLSNTEDSMNLEYAPSSLTGVTGLTPLDSFTYVRWIDLNKVTNASTQSNLYFAAFFSTSSGLVDYDRSYGSSQNDNFTVQMRWMNGPQVYAGSEYITISDYTKSIVVIKRNDASAGAGGTGTAHIDIFDEDGTQLANFAKTYTIPASYTLSGTPWANESKFTNIDELAYLDTFVSDSNLNTLYETVGSKIKPKDFTSHANLLDWYRFGGSDTKALVTPVNGTFPTLVNSAFTSSDAIPALATTDNLYMSGPGEATQNLVESKSTFSTTLNGTKPQYEGASDLDILVGSDAATFFGTSGSVTTAVSSIYNLGKYQHSKFKPDVDFSTSRWIFVKTNNTEQAGWRGLSSFTDGYLNQGLHYIDSGSIRFSNVGGATVEFSQFVSSSVIAGGSRVLEIAPTLGNETNNHWHVTDAAPDLIFTHHGTSTTFTANLIDGFNCVTTYDAPTDPENGIPESAVCMYINGNKVEIHTTTESGTDYVKGYAPADNYFKGDETYTHESSTFSDNALQYGTINRRFSYINNHLDFTRVLTAAEASKLYNGGKLLDFTNLSTNTSFPVSKTNLVRAYDADQHVFKASGAIEGLKDVSGYGLDIIDETRTYSVLTDTVSPSLSYMATPSLKLANVFKISSNLSISGWFKTTDTGTLFSNTDGAAADGMKLEVNASNMVLTLIDSSQTVTAVADVDDGNWHHVVVVKPIGAAPTIKIYVDGVEKVSTTVNTISSDDVGGGNGFTLLGDGQENAHATSPGATDASKLSARISNWSVHSEVLSADAVKQIYSNGHVRNIKNLPSVDSASIKAWWQLQDPTTPEQDSSGNSISLVYQDGASAALTTKLENATGEVLAEDIINGNAITMSITKSFNFTTKKWVETADQDAAICLSFNGFEEQAEYFALWKCNQTLPDGAVNVLDGGWHNLILSYRGINDLTGSNNVVAGTTEVRFGVGDGATDEEYHFTLSIDGYPMALVAGTDKVGADYIGGLGSTLGTETIDGVSKNVKFVIEDRHLRYDSNNSEEVYKPHGQFSAAIHPFSASETDPNNFRGSVDETSFHSQCFWLNQGSTGIQAIINQEKPYTIYGRTSALANRGNSNTYPVGVPYPLLNPELLVTSGSINDMINTNQFINPVPKGQTQPWDSQVSTGGLEAWYRWGDTDGDCSVDIKDVRTHNANGYDRFLTSIELDDTAATGNVIAATGESIYLQSQAAVTSSGSTTEYLQVKLEDLATLIGTAACTVKSMPTQILQYIRIKLTGAGTCDIGEDKLKIEIHHKKRRMK